MVDIFANIAPKISEVSNASADKIAAVTKAKTEADIKNSAVL